jgi:putative membrane-bound dehydrogenase-like protein
MSPLAGQRLPMLIVLVAATSAAGQGYPPHQATGKMTVPDGFTVKLVAAEPDVRQPVAIDFDDRGRLWVMQYLQYPNPAGLKRVKVDRYSRTVYDRVPEPPPKGPKGADRLTILEPDPAKPGALRTRDFVSGLNLGSGFAFGHGGVFVLQAPYLLFYPDRDRDDMPDGDPDVLLSGFGMEDAHSVANSLTWGPDGWLYGCQGSTVTAHIRGIEFQQGVWRYHPITRQFELFCEGGGNSWGLDFDRFGNLLYSTNFGGFTMLHGVQGGYYWKSFGKHGALHNPHAYGYFGHVPHTDFRGGHVTVGGIVYRGDNFPARFRERYVAADLLGHAVRWHEIEPSGSSFRSHNGGELLRANDTWFAPSDVCLGPDGCVYVADWCDARTAHPDPDAEWDKTNGRIYRIAYGDPPPVRDLDLSKKSSAELVKLLGHPNDWYARTARRILADRRDPEVILPLRTMVREAATEELALQAVWALYVSGGFTESYGVGLLGDRREHVRSWAVRLLGDEPRLASSSVNSLVVLARSEPSLIVRSQLAATARQLPAAGALAIVREIAGRDFDARDPHIPLLLWWAVEHHAIPARDTVVKTFAAPAAWASTLTRTVLLPRLTRRYAAEGTADGDRACVALVQSAPGGPERAGLWEALALGFGERPGTTKPADELMAVLQDAVRQRPANLTLTALLARTGDAGARQRLWIWAKDRGRPAEARVAAIGALAESPAGGASPGFAAIVVGDEPAPVRLAAIAGFARTANDAEAAELLAAYGRLPGAVKTRVRSAMLSRRGWAALLLHAVETGRVPATDFATDELAAVAAHGDKDLDTVVRKLWGNVRGPTPGEKLAEVRRFNNDLRAGPGDANAGKVLFTKHCAACHRLNGEGGAVGPDLTHANRGDRDFLLLSLVDPSAVIRKEYLSYTAETHDGRLVTGVITAQTPGTVTLTNAKAEAITLKRDQIASLRESPVSLMPEGLLTPLKPQELRDLFAYLQAPAPKQ